MKRLLTIILLLLMNATTLLSQMAQHNADVNNKVTGSVHIGDVVTFPNNSTGVVFYINPDHTGGWVVRSTDNATSPGVKWSTGNSNVNGIPDISNFSSLLSDVDGYNHTDQMRTQYGTGGNTTYSATSVDFNNGWYLPAAGQLRKLFSMLLCILRVLMQAWIIGQVRNVRMVGHGP